MSRLITEVLLRKGVGRENGRSTATHSNYRNLIVGSDRLLSFFPRGSTIKPIK